MNKKFIKDSLGWGFMLWLIGYLLGILLFAAVPVWLLGWIIMPFGIIITLLVLFIKIKSDSPKYYLGLSAIWTTLAILLDYFLLVQVFKPADGYYKIDVYLYYALTFILPIAVGWYKHVKINNK